MYRSLRSRVAVLAVVLLTCGSFALSASPAYAATDDVITNLDVRFDVRADGTVGATYHLDYRFSETGRRGIVFSIIRKEPYGDAMHDARYDISNIEVDSPSGAPDAFEQTSDTAGDGEQLTLRIGDEDKPLTTRNASYVIRYDLAGALETHDDYAELYRDVTTDYPPVENYSVSVTAPGGVRDTECAAGDSTCAQAIEEGTARYTGTNLAEGVPLTVAAKLDGAQISDARPQLELQRITSPHTVALDSTTVVRPDAAVEVRQVTTHRFPERGGEVTYAIPVRRPFSDSQDQLFQVSNVTVTDAAGARLGVRERLRDQGSDQDLEITVEPDPAALSPVGIATLTLSYQVTGAVHGDPSQARLRWPLVSQKTDRFTEISAAYQVPGPLTAVSCERQDEQDTGCGLPPAVIADRSATVRIPRDLRVVPAPDREQIVVTMPAASVGDPVPVLGESLDRREAVRASVGLLGALGIVIALITGSLVTSRGQAFANRRYAGVPPGVINRGGAVADDDRVQPPVRFEAPDTDLATAGLLLDRRFEARHATAELVAAAVRGMITIQTHPSFTVRQSHYVQPQGNQPASSATWFDAEVLRVARAPGDPRPTTPQELTRIVTAVRRHQPARQRGSTLFTSPQELKPLKRARSRKAWLAFGVLLALLIGLRFALVPVLGGWATLVPLFGIGAAAIACLIWRFRVGNPSLSADGTALLDQIIGFRTYLTTAEAHQLRFEAGQDIYSRYLPWAVLFDITDKWTDTCQQLVAQGASQPLRTYWIDASPASLAVVTTNLGYQLSSAESQTLAAAAAAASESSGSGGSSAFSGGGISSGGGGGGTSVGSW